MANEIDVVAILKTKLSHVDQDCESETRAAVAELVSGVKYEGGRLRAPDLERVANLMASVIYCKEKKFNSEISRILGASGGLKDAGELERMKELVSAHFQEERYLKRFEGFLESIERSASRYGVKFDRQAYRTDLAASLFSCGATNSLRRANASVHAELALHLHEKSMNREPLPGINDIVDLKPNIAGFGINLNALFKRLATKCKK